MGIQYLDGIRLYRTVVAGIRKVVTRKDYLNKINVFPVPDSDTGTNMAYTLLTIEDNISGKAHSDINRMAASIADSALDGARGNSGAILAQFLIGFGEGLRDCIQVNVKQFSRAVMKGKNYAYEALSDPVEGTILTVISDWADAVRHISEEMDDFVEMLNRSLEAAQKSLLDTPKKLAVLAKAGVVDAGGQGFVDFLEGIQDFIHKGAIAKSKKIEMEPSENVEIDYDTTYRYCTEVMITGENIDRQKIKTVLIGYGGSLVLAGTKHKTRVHIHTDDPKKIMEICGDYGELSNEKADDMLQQQKDAHTDHDSIAVVLDSGCDLPEELIDRYNLHMVPVRLSFGDDHYVDKVTMTNDEFWEESKSNPVHPKTSQPTPGDFRRQYQFLGTHFGAAVSIHLPAKTSGTYQSADTASRTVPEFPTTILDGNNVSVGLGLIALSTAEAIEAGKSFDEVLDATKQAIENTKIYIGLESLDNAVKGGRVSASKKKLADMLRLNPILTVKGSKVDSAGVTLGRKNIHRKLYKFVLKKMEGSAAYRVGIAHAKCEAVAREIEKDFIELLGKDRVIFTEVGPALGVHAGPGGLAIAIQKCED